jgi:multidrug efflux pump subunit AcrB
MGLSVVGILVDDAIVVLEYYRHMEMGKIGFVQRMTEQLK